MPSYQFICNECGNRFSVFESIDQHERHEDKCPDCGSKALQQEFGGVQVRTSRKS